MKNLKDIEKEFDKIMPSEHETDRDYYNPWKGDVKQFIFKTITSIINDIKKDLPEEETNITLDSYNPTPIINIGRNNYRQEVIKILNSYKQI